MRGRWLESIAQRRAFTTRRLIGSVEEPKQQIARGDSRPDSLRRGLPPIPQLQRTLGNKRVAQLIQARRLAPHGEITNTENVRLVSDPIHWANGNVARVAVDVRSASFGVGLSGSPLTRARNAAAAIERKYGPQRDF